MGMGTGEWKSVNGERENGLREWSPPCCHRWWRACGPLRLCSPPLAAFALSFVQECAEEWVIKFVATASDAKQKGFFGESFEIVPIVRVAQVARTNFVNLRCGHISQEVR